MTKQTRVLLADDHPLVRNGIRAILFDEPDVTLVGEATNGDEAQQLCCELSPDVILLDLSMPGPAPTEIVTYVQRYSPTTRIIVLTASDDNAHIHDLAAAGVAGYVLKDDAIDAVISAIRSVMCGETWFSRPIVQKLMQPREVGGEHGEELAQLTDRERHILQLMVRGWDNARIAGELNLAEQTVRNYTSRIYIKLGLRSRAETIIWAYEHGLIDE